jgi:hypothetical protein
MHIFKKEKQKEKQSIMQCGLISGIKTCSETVL